MLCVSRLRDKLRGFQCRRMLCIYTEVLSSCVSCMTFVLYKNFFVYSARRAYIFRLVVFALSYRALKCWRMLSNVYAMHKVSNSFYTLTYYRLRCTIELPTVWLRWLTVSCTAMQRINEALLLFECTPAWMHQVTLTFRYSIMPRIECLWPAVQFVGQTECIAICFCIIFSRPY